MKLGRILVLVACGAVRVCADDTETEFFRERINAAAEAGRDREALPWIERLLALRRTYFGEAHPDVARAFISYALTYEKLGENAEAERWFGQALAMLEQVAPDTEALAFCLHKYGWFVKDRKDFARAEPLLLRALAVREKALGLDHPDTAWSVRNLAWIARFKGDLPRAIALFERCAELREKVRGPRHVETLDNLRDLADTCLLARLAARGLALLRDAAAREEQASGAKSAALANRLARLGEALRDHAEPAEAVQVFQRVLAIRQHLGADDATAFAWEWLSMAQAVAKQPDDAIASRLEARRLWEKVQGANSPNALILTLALGQLHRHAGRLQEARPYYEQHAAGTERVFGAEHEKTRAAHAALAKFLHNDLQDYPAASSRYARLLKGCRRVLGDDHAETIQAMHDRAWSLHLGGENDAAELLFREALERRTRLLGEQHENTLVSLQSLSVFFMNRRRTAEFAATARRVVAIGERLFGMDDERVATYRAQFAEALTRAGDKAGVAQMRHTLLEHRRRHPTTDAVLLEAILACAAADHDTGAFASAVALREEALAMLRRATPPDAGKIAETMGKLAWSCEALGQWDQAETLRRETLAYAEQELGAGHAQTRQALTDVGWLYKQMNRPAEGVPFLRQVVERTSAARGREHSDTAWALRNLALCLQDTGDLTAARRTFDEAMEIRRIIRPPPGDGWMILADYAELLEKMKLYAEAEPLRRAVLEQSEQVDGLDHERTLAARKNLAWLFRKTERFDDAEKLYRDAAATSAQTFGAEDPRAITALKQLGLLYYDWRRHAQAVEIFEQVLALRRKVLGPTHEHTLGVMDNLADALIELKEFPRAEPLLREALELTAQVHGEEHAETAEAVRNCARLLARMQRWQEADAHYRRALVIREKVHGPESPKVADICVSVAWCARERREFAESEAFYRRALRIRTAALGPDHLETLDSLDDLGYLHEAKGDPAGARRYFAQELAALERTVGDAHPQTISCLQELAVITTMAGDLAGGETLFQRTLRASEQVFGAHHSKTMDGVKGLALIAMSRGDLAGAEPHARRALEIAEKVFGPEDRETGAALFQLAMLTFYLGNAETASEHAERSLGIFERAPGVKPGQLAMALCIAAMSEFPAGHNDRCIERGERALALVEADSGSESPLLFTPLYLLSLAYVRAERLDDALRTAERNAALNEKALGPATYQAATSRFMVGLLAMFLGDPAKAAPHLAAAAAVNEQVLGLRNPTTALTLQMLARFHSTLGECAEAEAAALKLQDSLEGVLGNVLSFGSEQQRLDYQAQAQVYSVLATLGHAPALARAVLRHKGVVLDSLLEDRRVAASLGGTEWAGQLVSLRQMRQQLFELSMQTPREATPAELAHRTQERGRLARVLADAESQLARRATALGRTRSALMVTSEQVQAALPADTALVEFIRTDRFTPANSAEAIYGAIVFAASGAPQWVALGDAETLEKAVRRFQLSARGKTDRTTLAAVLRDLHTRVWAPLEPLLPADVQTVVVCPDGELNALSFATLLDDRDRFLAERYALRYAASGRDLLRPPHAAADGTLAIFAAPDFERAASPKVTAPLVAAADTRDFNGQRLGPLPGTAAEAGALAAAARRRQWPATLALGADATEARVAALHAPRVLHLATHGFFLPEIPRPRSNDDPISASLLPGAGPRSVAHNPMHRSGLALAGAQATLEAWARGETPSPGDDGILTAEEVGALDLDGTWLVVLSACETGSGEARAGEGVLGLRRGFIQAGAQNLLLTLWPIADETTVAIMLDFYDRAFASGDAPRALAATQRDWLVKLREENGLLHAVNRAGAFIMSSQGP